MPSPALDVLIDIVGLDRNLVAAAAEGESPRSPALQYTAALDRWVASLEEREKVALLSRVARGDTGISGDLMRRYRRQALRPSAPQALRTAGALRARAEEFAERHCRAALAREASERARRDQELAASREWALVKLMKRQGDAWRRVEALIATKRPANYDSAVSLLQDLHEIGQRKGRSTEITARIRALRDTHAAKPSFLARLRKVGL